MRRRGPAHDAGRRQRRAVDLRADACPHLLPAPVLAEEVAAEAEQDGEEDEGQGDHQHEPHASSLPAPEFPLAGGAGENVKKEQEKQAKQSVL